MTEPKRVVYTIDGHDLTEDDVKRLWILTKSFWNYTSMTLWEGDKQIFFRAGSLHLKAADLTRDPEDADKWSVKYTIHHYPHMRAAEMVEHKLVGTPFHVLSDLSRLPGLDPDVTGFRNLVSPPTHTHPPKHEEEV